MESNINDFIEEFSVETLDKVLGVLLDSGATENYIACDDDLCDDEGCVLYKAFRKYLSYN
jgi:hypothetical protein